MKTSLYEQLHKIVNVYYYYEIECSHPESRKALKLRKNTLLAELRELRNASVCDRKALRQAAEIAAVKIADDFGLYADKPKQSYKGGPLDREAIALIVEAFVSAVGKRG